MKDIKAIERKIEEISKMATKEERRLLNSLRNTIISYNDKIYYEANYDKKLCIANYNKFLNDVGDLDKENFYLIFIRIPDIRLSFHLDTPEKEFHVKFLNELKSMSSRLSLAKRNVYSVCDYVVLLAYKNDVNEIYNKIKKIKESKNCWKNYQMTYIKFRRYSGKTNKNISACIKQAYNIFSGVNKTPMTDEIKDCV